MSFLLFVCKIMVFELNFMRLFLMMSFFEVFIYFCFLVVVLFVSKDVVINVNRLDKMR